MLVTFITQKFHPSLIFCTFLMRVYTFHIKLNDILHPTILDRSRDQSYNLNG